MKIRLGFVSNSSSSSFCIYGYYIDCNSPERKTLSNNYKRIDERKLYFGGPDGSYCLGLPIDEMKDDETKVEFIKRAEKEIKECMFELGIVNLPEGKPQLHQEGWYDG